MRMLGRKVREWLHAPIRDTLIRHSLALFTGNSLSLAIGLVASVVLARTLGSRGYGLVILAITLVNTVVQFADLRTDEGLIRFMSGALARGGQREAITFFYVGLLLDLLLAIATVLLALATLPFLTRAYKDGEILRQMISIYVISIPFSTMEDTFASLLSVFKRFGMQSAIAIVVSLFRMICLVSLARYGLVAVVWGYTAVSGFSFLASLATGIWLLSKNLTEFRGSGFRDVWSRFLPFAFHTSLTASLITIAKNVEILVLGALRPVAEVSFFKIAQSAASLIAMPTAPVATVLYPELSEAWATNQRDRVRVLVSGYVKYALVVSALIYVGLTAVVDPLVRVIYTSQFLPVGNLVRILGLGVILGNVFHWVRPATLARGKPELATFYNFGSLALRATLVIPLVYYFGAMGAAWSYNFAVCLSVALIVCYVLPHLDGKPNVDRSPGEQESESQ